jgi:NTE family protein
MKKLRKNEKVGLALGGGAVLGAAHIGVLRALEEFDISVRFISGTSIGAFVAAFFAFNKHWKDIREIALDLKWLDISAISLSKMGLLSNKKLGALITRHIGDVNFDQAGIPLAMIATDISNGEKVILKEGKIADAVMASTCIPGIFKPLEIGDKLLVDGGIVENVPMSPLQKMGADYIIAVDLHAGYSQKKPEGIVEVLLNTFNFAIMNVTKLQTEEADALIKPDLSSFNFVDADQTEDLVEEGYSEAKKVFNKIT